MQFKLAISTAAFIPLLMFGTSNRCSADVVLNRASAGVRSLGIVQATDFATGEFFATAQIADSATFPSGLAGSASGFATAQGSERVSRTGEVDVLGARAQGEATIGAFVDVAASASWDDRVVFPSPSFTEPFRIHFSASGIGEAQANDFGNATVVAHIRLFGDGNLNATELAIEAKATNGEIKELGSLGSIAIDVIPHAAALDDGSPVSVASFNALLDVSAIASGGRANVDYSHTLSITAVTNLNDIPLDSLGVEYQFGSGMAKPVAVPEPDSFICLSTVGVAMVGWLFFTKKFGVPAA